MKPHEKGERRQMPDTLIDRLRSTDVDVVLVAALQAAAELERTRDKALELAAKVCEAYAVEVNGKGYYTCSKGCAAAIRALKSGATDE